MKTTLLLIACFFFTQSILAADDTPVPPEVQKLVESMLTAFKASDDAALKACWVTPEIAGKQKAAEVTKEGKDPIKEEEKEIKRETKNLQATASRAAQMRTVITKHFGELSQLTLNRVELDVDKDSVPEKPRYSNVKIRLRSGDGTALKLEIDDAVQIDGVWKFQGRMDDEITIELPDED